MKKINPKEHYDVVIIGAGISGLTSSALFRRAGLSCCIIEMNNTPGGSIQGFNRLSYRFDSAIHWINNCGPTGLVTRIFKLIGSDYPKSKEQKRIRRFISDDFDYLITNNPDEIKEQWVKEFPHEKNGIIRFFRDAKRIAKSFDKHTYLSRTMDTMNWFESAIYGIKMLKFALPFIPHIRFSGDEGVKKGLKRYFKDEKLLSVFCSEPDLLSCLIPISWAYSNDFQTPPQGGSQRFAEWLTYATQHLGGDIFFKSKVSKILIENNTAVGVKIDHRGSIHEIRSKYVVAACDVETLFEKMLPDSAIPNKTKENLKSADLYASAFTVALGLDCPAEELGFDEEIIYLADPKVGREELGGGDPYKSGIHILASSVRDKTLALPEHGTLTLFIPAWMSSNNYWQCEKDESGNYIRGEKYKTLKQKFADIIIDRVQEKIAPNLKDHILHCDVATPVTHYRYTGNKDGSMMGQRPGKENMKAKVATYKTPVKNLLRSGHWADLGGGVPIAIKSALNTTLMILKKENKPVFRLLANYMDGNTQIDKIDTSSLLNYYDNSWKQSATPAEKAISKRAMSEIK
ncbi:MAG: NAD(P)/FAD-dependent oxidoreductase [Cyclobacteriaceae bacterium]|nr:NAD(P)/FAD-dependent oxidoreductase [Cyclobacteriaceae bacterium]